VLPIISGTLKAMNFKFGRNIRRLNPSKRPLKILETRGRWRSQGLCKIFRAAIYRAHRAVVFVIAQLSCYYADRRVNVTVQFQKTAEDIAVSLTYINEHYFLSSCVSAAYL